MAMLVNHAGQPCWSTMLVNHAAVSRGLLKRNDIIIASVLNHAGMAEPPLLVSAQAYTTLFFLLSKLFIIEYLIISSEHLFRTESLCGVQTWPSFWSAVL
jgi:hypothetical protein